MDSGPTVPPARGPGKESGDGASSPEAAFRAGYLGGALALKPADVDPKAGTNRVLRGTGRKARTVAIDEGGLRYVERRLAQRGRRGLNGRRPIFTKLDGSRWSPRSMAIWRWTASIRSAAGRKLQAAEPRC